MTKFYNEVVEELFNSIGSLIPPQQFKTYATSQKTERWSLKKRISGLTDGEKLLSGLDGYSVILRRLCSTTYRPEAGDLGRFCLGKNRLGQCLTKWENFKKEVMELKRDKFPKGLETLFLSNEWEFLDSVLKEINERVNCLNKLKTSIVTNEKVAKRRLLPNRENSIEGKRALKSKRKNKKKADQRKQKRLEAHMAEVTKILTGHNYKRGEIGMVMDNEKLTELSPKMHLESMKELLSQDCFAKESADQVDIFLRSMERSNKRKASSQTQKVTKSGCN